MWTRARHLLGAVCNETYREGVACLVLILMGHGRELGTALAESERVSAEAECGGSPAPAPGASSRTGRTEAVDPPPAVDKVQEELYRFIRLRHEEGELAKV